MTVTTPTGSSESPGGLLSVDRLLLEGKLSIPRVPDGSVSRADIIRRVVTSGARVASVVAPPGYGKSTLLAEWASVEERRMAWLRLDSYDDDPAALLARLAIACAPFSDQTREVASVLALGEVAIPLGRGAPLLAAALRATREPFVLFLDDVHEVASVACEDVLDVVLGAVPEGSLAVVASRRTLPYVAATRVAGAVVDIGPNELRLDVAGARSIARQVRAEAPEDDLASWVRRCDGWPTGLFLCAVIARDGTRTLHGTEQELSDYLYRECLAGLPDDLVEFLLRTSVLQQFTDGLCDAVLDDSSAARLLREARDRQLFLIPVNREHGWYRYHDLFREFLQSELTRTRPPDKVTTLHARAAAWYETNRLPAHAIDHLLAAGERESAARVIGSVALSAYQSGNLSLVDRWLSDAGDEAVARYPLALVLATWIALVQGAAQEAERHAHLLARAGGDDPDIEAHRAMIRAAMCVDGVDAALVDSGSAVRAVEPWSPWRDQALKIHGTNLYLAGDSTGARIALTEAAALAPQSHTDTPRLSEAFLAIIALEGGDWETASRHVRTALESIHTRHIEGYGMSTLALAVAARIAAHERDHDRAKGFAAKAMLARVRATYAIPAVAVAARLHLARAFLMLSDRSAAALLLAEVDDILRLRPRLGRLAEEATDVHALAASNASDSGRAPLTLAELRLLPYLQTHLTLAEIGGRLSISRNTVSTQAASIYRKLGVTTRSAAVDAAIRRGLLGA
jgi:LuxR family maltose regulon positive regulatory protein